MHLKKLRIIDFRNIVKAELEFSSAFNFFVLYGDNGSGKTSILEAISLLNSSKGMQKAKLSDVINYDAKGFGVLATLKAEDDLDDIEVKLTYQSNKKEFFIDNEKLQRLSQLAMLGNVCWVTPASDRLFYDSKKPRRDFFDRLVYAIDKNLAKNLNTYNYLLQNRMKLLQSGKTEGVWLDKLEQEISVLGVDILKSRMRYVSKLNSILENYDLSFDFVGSVEKTFAEEIDNVEYAGLELKWQDILKANRIKDLRVNGTNFGIHKTDIKGLRASSNLMLESSSMGQHKKALIDLIIAHVKLVKQVTNETICLLIDEITSHLDDKNKKYLFDNLEELRVQTFLTGVRKTDFEVLDNKAIFMNVNKGNVTLD
ncbi:MAG: DNA replication and repair protein RecF [Proteobacteria bacterium]|nr:MAG: DNA replication and repair protein RecF [Pseudomonadota bacterium]